MANTTLARNFPSRSLIRWKTTQVRFTFASDLTTAHVRNIAQTDFSISNFDGVYAVTDYTEGVFLDYRHFDQQDIEPLYPFGYGLRYVHEQFSSLS